MTGPLGTRAEVIEAFQRTHRNHLGRPLRVDGILGPQTQWAMDLETLCAARQQLVRVAQPQLGLREVPPRSNDDPKGIIRGWLRHARAKPGDPWCAAFVAWCLSQVLSRPVRIAGALALARSFPEVDDPMAGDLFCYPTDDLGHGHIGIIEGSDALEIMNVEGNCDNELRCTRRLREPHLEFHRPILDTLGTRPGVVPSVAFAPGATR